MCWSCSVACFGMVCTRLNRKIRSWCGGLVRGQLKGVCGLGFLTIGHGIGGMGMKISLGNPRVRLGKKFYSALNFGGIFRQNRQKSRIIKLLENFLSSESLL